MYTPYHSQYWANMLTLRGLGGEIVSLSRSIANTRVDLNPHQIDAALFALHSPFSTGAILADEVGLGKTIEASIVISQKWAERKRHILIIVPAMLRNQWGLELAEKFYINTTILDSKIYSRFIKSGWGNPFSSVNEAIICSYNFASTKAGDISQVPWDLVVIDEAHRLRNAYQSISRVKNNPSSKKTMSHRILEAVGNAPKLLLTATPLQNSLLELYSLISAIDPHIFGDLRSFKSQFVNNQDERERNAELRSRLSSACIRTLRKQVSEYVPFTNRTPITQEFYPTPDEQFLYDEITSYLRREVLYALPSSQRQLITMVLRKLLASSTFAIAKTLRKLADRLENVRKELSLFDDEDLEGFEAYEDELFEEVDEFNAGSEDKRREFDPIEFKKERDDLYRYADLASKIAHNAKGDALLHALQAAFQKAEELGAARKAVIFTESRETQNYLSRFLAANGYADQIVTINGSNNELLHNQIYSKWLAKNSSSDRVSGSRDVDVKAALVDYFKDSATILIATEAAAEGLNLQFCSLVVNYDLPWNPQRIEQRIGRCHRYGQKHDVVVVNFVNRRNEADKRVYELLSKKFRLFDGVLGASDEILGALQSGVDIEKRIAAVYQNCRTEEEIKQAFETLQKELDDKIKTRMTSTRKALIENFDEEVREKLRFSEEQTRDCLSKQARLLYDLTKTELGNRAIFSPSSLRFEFLDGSPKNRFFNFDWKDAEKRGENFYRRDCPLAQALINRALGRNLTRATLVFDYSNYLSKMSVIERLLGHSGWLSVSRLSIHSVDLDEFLIFAAKTDDGKVLDDDICQKLFALSAVVESCKEREPEDLNYIRKNAIKVKIDEIQARNVKFFDEETIKIDRWSEDLKLSLEAELKDLDDAIKATKRESTLAQTLEEKLGFQKKIRELERRRSQKRMDLFDAQDTLDQKRDELIAGLESQLKQKIEYRTVFTVRWVVK